MLYHFLFLSLFPQSCLDHPPLIRAIEKGERGRWREKKDTKKTGE
jgi:hypothetical protein